MGKAREKSVDEKESGIQFFYTPHVRTHGNGDVIIFHFLRQRANGGRQAPSLL